MRILSWLLTVPFLLAFTGVLLFFDPLQRIARLFGQRPQEIVAGGLQIGLVWAFRIAGTRIDLERSPDVLPGRPYLFIANHQSMFDIPIFGAQLFSNFPKYVAKRELAHWIPSISYNLRRGGNAIIDRGDREQATRVLRELAAQVEERGVSAVIYPEGTRARDGKLGRFRPTGTLVLLEAAPNTPVVPVMIDESWRLLQHNLLPVPFGTRIRVKIGDPIERHPGEDPKVLLRTARETIQETIEEWRAR